MSNVAPDVKLAWIHNFIMRVFIDMWPPATMRSLSCIILSIHYLGSAWMMMSLGDNVAWRR
jgi:hypothetical protein